MPFVMYKFILADIGCDTVLQFYPLRYVSGNLALFLLCGVILKRMFSVVYQYTDILVYE